jgi:hypothetical protein
MSSVPKGPLAAVRLRNGSDESGPLVLTAMASLSGLMQSNPIALYELVMKARDPQHAMFGRTAQEAIDRSLLQPDGSMHDSLRNIILSAADGDGLYLRLIDPRADTSDPRD